LINFDLLILIEEMEKEKENKNGVKKCKLIMNET
jgi:hypothetical protein